VCTLLAVGAIALVPAAHAHHTDNVFPTVTYQHFCSSETYCLSDNSTLSFFRQGSLSQSAKNLIWNTLYDLYGYPTVLTLKHENPPVYSGGAETDLVFRILAALPNTTAARVVCDDVINSADCDQFFVNFATDFWSKEPHVVCHEIGHGLGFTHGRYAYPPTNDNDNTLDCMSNASDSPYRVGAHMRPQINSTYPPE
jgi:hypothetical protein